ncbi:MAG: 2'-5' RNA ligase family protein [Clostridiales bacterium]|nr:2'-5' RNA ligase family protein [Clostridiales bacterium]
MLIDRKDGDINALNPNGDKLIKRSIILFPDFENEFMLDAVRKCYDPQASKIAPHITLVFPFESYLTGLELKAHIDEAKEGLEPFYITAEGVERNGEYLYIPLTEGSEEIIKLHNHLYKGILERFLNDDIIYTPHVTIGRFNTMEELDAVFEKVSRMNFYFESEIDRIIIEQIGIKEISNIEFELDL